MPLVASPTIAATELLLADDELLATDELFPTDELLREELLIAGDELVLASLDDLAELDATLLGLELELTNTAELEALLIAEDTTLELARDENTALDDLLLRLADVTALETDELITLAADDTTELDDLADDDEATELDDLAAEDDTTEDDVAEDDMSADDIDDAALLELNHDESAELEDRLKLEVATELGVELPSEAAELDTLLTLAEDTATVEAFELAALLELDTDSADDCTLALDE